VTPFDRQPAPPFWASRERRFLEGTRAAKDALHTLQHERRSLAAWFHELVRPASDPRLCAYCDGPLAETSPQTIDHFIPEHADRTLGLAWTNLFPACACCNSTHKGKRWSCRLVRPDRDPVDRWILFDVETGRVLPAPEIDRRTRARVRLTLGVLGLNTVDRCKARRRLWKSLENAFKTPPDRDALREHAEHGPYRFVAALFMKTVASGSTLA
jgi:uncharacterized protein (TIGR02646 family)